MNSRTKLAILVAIVVIAVAAAIALVPGSGSDQGNKHTFPSPIEDGDRDYPSADEAEESYAETIETLRSSLSDPSLGAEEMAESIEAAAMEYLKMKDYWSWLYLDYSENPSGFKDAYTAWTKLSTHLYDDLATALKESLSSSCSRTVEEALEICGMDPEEYRDYGEMTQEEKDLRQQETSLVAEYTKLKTEEYVMTYEGKEWTTESIKSSTTLTDDQKSDLAQMLYDERYGEAAEIYAELVGIRNDIAVLNGYENYAEYSYIETYGRDYTTTEAKSFADLIEVALSEYMEIEKLMKSDASMSSDRLSWMNETEKDGFIDLVSPFIDSISDEYAELLDYMVEYDLIDLCDDSGRQTGAYTQELWIRHSAMIYVGKVGEKYDGSDTATVLIHEFGHAANMCLNPRYSACYDINEIHSQGFESLYCASGLVGEGARAMAADNLATTLYYSVVMPGLITELELWAYETEAETGPLTGTQVRDEFVSILESHGYNSKAAAKSGYYWAQIPHLFTSPNYYISYGTSAINAIELFVEATEDYDVAKGKYLDLVFQQGIEGYSEAVKEAGFVNAFDTDAARAILEACIPALKSLEA